MPDDIPIAKPVLKEPTVSRPPPAGRLFPCPACGARLEFDPNSRGLKCPYCGYDRKIDRNSPEEIPERDYQEYLEREEACGKAIPGRSSEVRCTGCGANVLLEDKMATEKCPFCATHLESQPEVAHSMIPPESLLPFTVDLREARAEFEKWLKTLWFAPHSLKKLAALSQLTGVYIPYWTYDAMTVTFYEGERGEDYTTTESYTDANGNRHTRTVVHTNWYPVSGEVRHFFDDLLLCSSKSVPADLLAQIDQWNLQKLEPFRAEFLSGFRTERYSVNLREGYKIAKEMMQPTIHSLVRQDIGGDRQRVHDQRTRYSGITFKSLLLPIWIAVYRYHDKPYQILVNGRTGRVAGYRPYSAWKIIGFVTLIVLVFIFVVLLVMTLSGH
jgi:DNA-directed RNA polymerase subunit RPC12/RpoP